MDARLANDDTALNATLFPRMAWGPPTTAASTAAPRTNHLHLAPASATTVAQAGLAAFQARNNVQISSTPAVPFIQHYAAPAAIQPSLSASANIASHPRIDPAPSLTWSTKTGAAVPEPSSVLPSHSAPIHADGHAARDDEMVILFAVRVPIKPAGAHAFAARVCEPVMLVGQNQDRPARSLVEALMEARTTLPMSDPTSSLVKRLIRVTGKMAEIVRMSGGVPMSVPAATQWHRDLHPAVLGETLAISARAAAPSVPVPVHAPPAPIQTPPVPAQALPASVQSPLSTPASPPAGSIPHSCERSPSPASSRPCARSRSRDCSRSRRDRSRSPVRKSRPNLRSKSRSRSRSRSWQRHPSRRERHRRRSASRSRSRSRQGRSTRSRARSQSRSRSRSRPRPRRSGLARSRSRSQSRQRRSPPVRGRSRSRSPQCRSARDRIGTKPRSRRARRSRSRTRSRSRARSRSVERARWRSDRPRARTPSRDRGARRRRRSASPVLWRDDSGRRAAAPPPEAELVKTMIKFVAKLSGGTLKDMMSHPNWFGRLNLAFRDVCPPQHVFADEARNVLTFWVPRSVSDAVVADVMRQSGVVIGCTRCDFEPADPNDAPSPDEHPPDRDVYVILHSPHHGSFHMMVQALRSRNITGDLDMMGRTVLGTNIEFAILTVPSHNTGCAEDLDKHWVDGQQLRVFKLDDAKAVFAHPGRLDNELEAMWTRSVVSSLWAT